MSAAETVVAACAALHGPREWFSVALYSTEILGGATLRQFSPMVRGVADSRRTADRQPEDKESHPSGTARTDADSCPPSLLSHPRPLTEGFVLPNLGLVIIDEQHKFGVVQRETLVRKGAYPHLLVMTATPIPRTLGLTLYGDLDVSVIDELPVGRGQIRTLVRSAAQLPRVWKFIRQQLSAGRQAYVVYPRVEETDGGSVKAVLHEFENVRQQLAPFPLGLLHGRLAPRDKEAVLAQFRANQVKVLLATSLIEVGLDVPNATVMLIENAEQFGLPQLHQLRGRIGRGGGDAYCILITATETPAARQRLRVLEETSDGFRIAEADLKLRGPGELLGRQQSGLPRFRFGNLVEDLDLILQARDWVARQRSAT